VRTSTDAHAPALISFEETISKQQHGISMPIPSGVRD
jgi:hypothetical protein